MTPDLGTLYDVTEATWPPARIWTSGPFRIRDGGGGGKRVSAATVHGALRAEDLAIAEEAMRALGQAPLFQIRAGDAALDDLLEAEGYRIVDPVNLYAAPLALFLAEAPPLLSTFCIWEPLEIMREIWADGGIGPGRINVMERAGGPKTGLLGRHDNHPAAAGFVALHKEVAMVHALEVRARHRRAGMGRQMMFRAAHWAADQRAQHFSVLCTRANIAANRLYLSMGFAHIGEYHYRVKADP